jgi:hypothetical protein
MARKVEQLREPCGAWKKKYLQRNLEPPRRGEKGGREKGRELPKEGDLSKDEDFFFLEEERATGDWKRVHLFYLLDWRLSEDRTDVGFGGVSTAGSVIPKRGREVTSYAGHNCHFRVPQPTSDIFPFTDFFLPPSITRPCPFLVHLLPPPHVTIFSLLRYRVLPIN